MRHTTAPESQHKHQQTNRVSFTVNDKVYMFRVGKDKHDISHSDTLAQTLRDRLGLMGTKLSCDRGTCGCCTVVMDGMAVLSCMILTVECDGRSITTIEGLEDPMTGAVSLLQQAFIDHTAFQCGFCTPGIILSAKALLDETPSPTLEEVQESLSGNFCRCISHYQVVEAVMAAADKVR